MPKPEFLQAVRAGRIVPQERDPEAPECMVAGLVVAGKRVDVVQSLQRRVQVASNDIGRADRFPDQPRICSGGGGQCEESGRRSVSGSSNGDRDHCGVEGRRGFCQDFSHRPRRRRSLHTRAQSASAPDPADRYRRRKPVDSIRLYSCGSKRDWRGRRVAPQRSIAT